MNVLLTIAAEVAVFAVDLLDVVDDAFVLTIFTLSRDVVDALKLLRARQATQKKYFSLCGNTQCILRKK